VRFELRGFPDDIVKYLMVKRVDSPARE